MSGRNDWRIELATAAREARESARLPQGWVADQMQAAGFNNWHQTTVSRVEKCTRPVYYEEALALATILGFPLPGVSAVRVATTKRAAWEAAMEAADLLVAQAAEVRRQAKGLRP